MVRLLSPWPGLGATRMMRRAERRAEKRSRYTGNYLTVPRRGLRSFGRGMKSARKHMRSRKIQMRKLREAGYW